MKKYLPVALSACLLGCQNVELQYAAPAPAASSLEQAKLVEEQALENYEYFVFARNHILLAPANESSEKSGTKEEKPAVKAEAKGTKAGAAAAKQDEPKPQPSTAENSKPLDTSPGTTMIDGKPWKFFVVPVPDTSRPLAVKGYSGFWKSTTIGISKYPNTDVVSSVSSKAENLVPKRIGQVASVAVAALKIASGTGVSDVGKASPLVPFELAVPEKNGSGRVPGTEDWAWIFTYDDTNALSGTVEYGNFVELTKNKKVNYWPAPACRSATLKLTQDSTSAQHLFHIVVSSPKFLRLHPLPIDGKMDLGTVCGASVSGITGADAATNIVDSVEALQSAIEQIKKAQKPDSSSAATTAPE